MQNLSRSCDINIIKKGTRAIGTVVVGIVCVGGGGRLGLSR